MLRHRPRLAPLATLAVCLVAGATWARAEPTVRVLVLSVNGEPVRPELIDALRIQLVNSAQVDAGDELPAGSLGDKLDAAARAVTDSGAELAVWIERAFVDGGGTDFVLYAVARRADRGLIEVGRVAKGDGAAVDRVLALKVGALLDDILTAAAGGLPEVEHGIARDMMAPPASIRTANETAASGKLLAEAGGVAALASGTVGAQAGVSVGVGGRLEWDRWSFEVLATVHDVGDSKVSDTGGEVSVDELLVAGMVRANIAIVPRWSLGVGIAAGARLLDARGESADGRTGDASRSVPVGRGGVSARVILAPRFELRAQVGVELALTRQRFALLGTPVADFGRARPIAELSFAVVLP